MLKYIQRVTHQRGLEFKPKVTLAYGSNCTEQSRKQNDSFHINLSDGWPIVIHKAILCFAECCGVENSGEAGGFVWMNTAKTLKNKQPVVQWLCSWLLFAWYVDHIDIHLGLCVLCDVKIGVAMEMSIGSQTFTSITAEFVVFAAWAISSLTHKQGGTRQNYTDGQHLVSFSEASRSVNKSVTFHTPNQPTCTGQITSIHPDHIWPNAVWLCMVCYVFVRACLFSDLLVLPFIFILCIFNVLGLLLMHDVCLWCMMKCVSVLCLQVDALSVCVCASLREAFEICEGGFLSLWSCRSSCHDRQREERRREEWKRRRRKKGGIRRE